MSCSFRATGPVHADIQSKYHIDYHFEKSGYNPRRRAPQPPEDTGDPNVPGKPKQIADAYMNSVEELCDVIYQRIFPTATGAHGLIVVSGATASGKSNIARGLIYKYLQTLVPDKNSPERRPHLVTFEDPIDKRWADDPDSAKVTGIDYTPRELTKDVDSLGNAVEAALRQTPKVFFVGEIRHPYDWKVLLQFAATGHVGVTTSHAGSLTEAMGQLLSSSKARTPARRSDVANRILALVHLRTKTLPEHAHEKTEGLRVAIPAIWVRSPISTKTLMADGLTALLPYRDVLDWNERPGTAGAFGCLGRTWFAEQLLNRADADVRSKFADEIRRVALTWDLEGL